jgi:hypothetical protein
MKIIRIRPDLFWCVIALVAGSLFTTAAADRPTHEAQFLPGNEAGTPIELAKRIGTLFSATSDKELDLLVTNPDSTIALSAGWERVRRTMPQAKQPGLVGPDSSAMSRFLGLLEGRIRFPIPGDWEIIVKDVNGYNRDQIGFSLDEVLDRSVEGHEGATPVSLQRSGDKWIVKQGDWTVMLPVEKYQGSLDKAAVETDGETAYVAVYEWPPYPYKLYAVHRSDSKVIWTTEVWAAGDWMGYEGPPGQHIAEIRSTDQEIAVFGVADTTAYIEVFDKRTGENKYRFGTAYFQRIK